MNDIVLDNFEKEMKSSPWGAWKFPVELTESRLKAFIKNPPPVAFPVYVKPEMARIIIERFNNGNRPVTAEKVKEYSAAMLADDWKMVGDTVTFSDAGDVFDGQHRLLASIRTGTPFVSLFYFDVDESLFWYKDGGKSRSASDGLSMMGWTNTNRVAAIARWLELYRTNVVKSRKTYAKHHIRDIVEASDKDRLRSATVMSERVYYADRTPSGPAGMLYYYAKEKNPALADIFFEAWVSGRFPASVRGLEKALTYIHRKKNDQSGRIHDVEQAAILIIAWNLATQRRAGSLQDFQFDAKVDVFPVIGG